jgi:hypothetical protein
MEAFSRIPQELNLAALRFRVGTPFAAEGAAFKKHHRPDAGTVVDAEFLNIKHIPQAHLKSPPS